MSRVGGFEDAIGQLGLLLTGDRSASRVQVDMVMKFGKKLCRLEFDRRSALERYGTERAARLSFIEHTARFGASSDQGDAIKFATRLCNSPFFVS